MKFGFPIMIWFFKFFFGSWHTTVTCIMTYCVFLLFSHCILEVDWGNYIPLKFFSHYICQRLQLFIKQWLALQSYTFFLAMCNSLETTFNLIGIWLWKIFLSAYVCCSIKHFKHNIWFYLVNPFMNTEKKKSDLLKLNLFSYSHYFKAGGKVHLFL